MSSDWVAAFFADADKKDIAALSAWFAPNIELRFANNPPLHGKEAAAEAMGGFYSTISAMRHKRENVIIDGNVAAQQAVVTYTDLNGREVPLPVASYLRRSAPDVLDRLWIYIDIAPLYAA